MATGNDRSSADDKKRTARIGRPPKLDEHGIPTRERLIQAAIDACVEFGYEGVTLSDIARRAEVSTPAIYSHFDGKADLLVEASQRELDLISSHRIPEVPGLLGLVHYWLQPAFARTRVLVAELHSAAHRHPEVKALLAEWQQQNSERLVNEARLTPPQVKMYYLLLLGASHLDAITGVGVSTTELEEQATLLVKGWLPGRYD